MGLRYTGLTRAALVSAAWRAAEFYGFSLQATFGLGRLWGLPATGVSPATPVSISVPRLLLPEERVGYVIVASNCTRARRQLSTAPPRDGVPVRAVGALWADTWAAAWRQIAPVRRFC